MNRQSNNPVEEGPLIRGHHIQHIDSLLILVVDGSAVELTRTEYLLVMGLLRQLEHLQNTNEPIEIYVSFEELQRIASLNNRTLLARHIYNSSAKLWTAGVSIARVDGFGYAIIFDAGADANRFLKHSNARQPGAHLEQNLCAMTG